MRKGRNSTIQRREELLKAGHCLSPLACSPIREYDGPKCASLLLMHPGQDTAPVSLTTRGIVYI